MLFFFVNFFCYFSRYCRYLSFICPERYHVINSYFIAHARQKRIFFEKFRIFLSPRKKWERESNYKIFQMYCYTISIRILFPFFIVTFLPYKQNCIKQYLQAIAHCLKFICFRPGMFTFPVLFIEKNFLTSKLFK